MGLTLLPLGVGDAFSARWYSVAIAGPREFLTEAPRGSAYGWGSALRCSSSATPWTPARSPG